MPRGMVVGGPHNVLSVRDYSGFAILQSRVHELWVTFFGSTLEDRQRYTPTDCFATFPFPPNRPSEEVGRDYYEHRAVVMMQQQEGLTNTYSRFHDPEEQDPDIVKLRELHAAMDRAVLDAYGWNDIPTDCEFLLDFEIEDEEEWGNKKKPWRFRWPDAVHDEVLARLLELNAERARKEALAGAAGKEAKGRGRRGRKEQSKAEEGDLFE